MTDMSANLANADHSRRSNWWYVDERGRKIGYMWPEDFIAAIESIWGYRQGIKSFAAYAGLNRTTVEFYGNGKTAIPKHIALLVEHMVKVMLDEKAHIKAHPWRCLPQIEAGWLPKERQDPKFTIEKLPNG